jgi:capsular polysaccharide transport system permease protein
MRAFRAVGALILREMATTHGKSPGGFLWAIAEPVAAIALLSFAFSLIFVAPPLGRDFALFYATGFLPFFLFLDVSQKIAASLGFSRPLLGFAGVTWVDAVLARFLLNSLTHLIIFALFIGTLSVVNDHSTGPDMPALALALAMAATLALGTGTVNAYLTGTYPVWDRIWSVLMRPMFIVSGVVFLFEDVPKQLQPWMAWNPLFHVTGEMRKAFYPTYHPNYVNVDYVFALSLGLLVIGACLLHRFHDALVRK